MEETLTKLKKESPDNLKLLTSILKNIINHPKDEKYRSLKKSNQKIAKFLTHDTIFVLTKVGFVEDQETIQFKNPSVEKLEEVIWLIEKSVEQVPIKEPEVDSFEFSSFKSAHVEKGGIIKFVGDKDSPMTVYGPKYFVGRYLWEVKIVNTTYPSNIMVGCANPEVHTNQNAFCSHGAAGYAYYGYYGTSFHNSQSQAYGEPYLSGDLIMAILDLDKSELSFYKNGVFQGPMKYTIQSPQAPAITLYSKNDSVVVNTNQKELEEKLKSYNQNTKKKVESEDGELKFVKHSSLELDDSRSKAKVVDKEGTIFGNKVYTQGKHAWEVKILKVSEESDIFIGVADPNFSNSQQMILKSSKSWSYHNQSGNTFYGNRPKDYSEDFGEGDVISCILDLDFGLLEFFKNGEYLGMGFANVVSPVSLCVSIMKPGDQVEIIGDQKTVDKILNYDRSKKEVEFKEEEGALKLVAAKGVVLSQDRMTISHGEKRNVARSIYGNKLYTKGKHYWQVLVNTTSNPSNIMIGVVNPKVDKFTKRFLTHGEYGFAYYGFDGSCYHKSKAKPYGEPFINGDVITVILNLDNGTLEFLKNGEHQGVAFTDVVGPLTPAITLFDLKDNTTLISDEDIVSKAIEESKKLRELAIELEKGPLKFKDAKQVKLYDDNMKAKMLEEIDQPRSILGTKVFIQGRHSWEIKILETTNPTNIMIGVMDPNALKKDNHMFLSNTKGWSYCGNNGSIYTNSKGKSFGEVYQKGDVIRVTVDLEKKTLEFHKNGVYQGTAFTDIIGPVSPSVTLYSFSDEIELITDIKEIQRDVKLEMEDLYD